MKTICVYAGSNLGNRPEYAEEARKLGRLLAEQGIELVYGGSKVGLMGEVANSVLEHGGRVVGVMPKGLFRGEVVHAGLTEFIEVKNMHERKALMAQRSDGFIALPGGFGTFEEWFEAISWTQIGIHNKPVALLNVLDYYTPLLRMVDHSIEAEFAQVSHRQLVVEANTAEELLAKMEQYQRPEMTNKWKQLED